MNPSRRFASVALLSVVSASLAEAQSGAFPQFRRPDPLWSVSIGARHYSGGASVDFGNLGTIPVVAPALDGDRVYANGSVAKDRLRNNEIDGDGKQISTPGERHRTYRTDADGTVTQTGDFVAYQDGFTRDWSYNSASQVTADGRIGMDRYGANSRGASMSAESDGGVGFDFNVTRRLGKISPKLEWGLSLGFGLSDLKAESKGTVTSDLRRLTDYYRTIDGTIPTAPYDAPTSIDLLGPDGTVLVRGGLETTTPLGYMPVGREDVLIPNGASVDGEWDIDGAYFLIRLGPTLRAKLTERIGFSVSGGLAAGYIGSTFHARESIRPAGISGTVVYEDETTTDEIVFGYYAMANAEFWMTERTGVYAGASYEGLADYDQKLGDRTATIDIGQGVAIRGGIVLRF